MNWMKTLARLLPPAERDPVLGDVAECGETAAQAARSVIGLIVRRQALAWLTPQPWIVLLGIVIPLGFLLQRASQFIAGHSAVFIWLYVNNWNWDFLNNRAFWYDLPSSLQIVGLNYLSLLCWSWTTGFAIAALSRKSSALNGALFSVVLLLFVNPAEPDSHAAFSIIPFYRVVLPLLVLALLVLLPAFLGMRRGAHKPLPPAILWLLIGITTIAILTPFRNPWPFQLARLAAYWPIAYCLARKVNFA